MIHHVPKSCNIFLGRLWTANGHENQWLEDVFPIEIVPFFGDMLVLGSVLDRQYTKASGDSCKSILIASSNPPCNLIEKFPPHNGLLAFQAKLSKAKFQSLKRLTYPFLTHEYPNIPWKSMKKRSRWFTSFWKNGPPFLGDTCSFSGGVRDWLTPYGCFQKWWYPQIIHFNRVFHYKSSILGYPYFRKHPYPYLSQGLDFFFQPPRQKFPHPDLRNETCANGPGESGIASPNLPSKTVRVVFFFGGSKKRTQKKTWRTYGIHPQSLTSEPENDGFSKGISWFSGSMLNFGGVRWNETLQNFVGSLLVFLFQWSNRMPNSKGRSINKIKTIKMQTSIKINHQKLHTFQSSKPTKKKRRTLALASHPSRFQARWLSRNGRLTRKTQGPWGSTIWSF